MKKVYTLNTSMMNGTVTMQTHSDIFSSKELAEKAKDAVEKANEHADFPCLCTIQESTLFESEEEVPILNRKNEEKEVAQHSNVTNEQALAFMERYKRVFTQN